MKLFGGGRPETPARAYDRVLVVSERGAMERTLTPEEFDGLGLDERVRLILGKRLQFYAGATAIPLKDALRDS